MCLLTKNPQQLRLEPQSHPNRSPERTCLNAIKQQKSTYQVGASDVDEDTAGLPPEQTSPGKLRTEVGDPGAVGLGAELAGVLL